MWISLYLRHIYVMIKTYFRGGIGMAFLDDFGKKLSTAADLAVDKAKDLA